MQCIINKSSDGKVSRVFNIFSPKLGEKVAPTETINYFNELFKKFTSQDVISTDVDAFNKAVADAIGSELKLQDDVVYGINVGNKIYLNPSLLNNETTLHELGHLQYALIDLAAARGDVKAQAIKQRGEELLTPIATKWQKALEGISPVGTGERFSVNVNGEEKTVEPIMVDVVDGFYSNIEKMVKQAKSNNFSATKWLSMLGKGDEMIYTGLKDFLDSKAPTEQITKAAILDFMAENRVQLLNVVLSNDNNPIADDYQKLINEREELRNKKNRIIFDSTISVPERDRVEKEMDGEILALSIRIDSISDRIDAGNFRPTYGSYTLDGPKQNYKEILITLKSSVVNKELNELIKNELNPASIEFYKIPFDELSYDLKERILINMDKSGKNEVVDRYNQLNNKGQFYVDRNHFKQATQNPIIAHVRLDTRIDESGSKVVHVNEFQSDWAEGGRDDGFNSMTVQERNKKSTEHKKLLKELKEVNSELLEKAEPIRPLGYIAYQINTLAKTNLGESLFAMKDYLEGNYIVFKPEKNSDLDPTPENSIGTGNLPEQEKTLVKDWLKSLERRLVILNRLDTLENELAGVDNKDNDLGPYVTNTNAWLKLAVKVATQEAVAQGAEKLVWDTGEVVAKRFSLSRVVDKLELRDSTTDYSVDYTATNEVLGTPGSKYKVTMKTLYGYKKGQKVYEVDINTDSELKELSAIVGKSTAEELLNSNWELGSRELEVNTTMGAEPMIGFYGSTEKNELGMVGKVVESIFGRNTVGNTTVNTGDIYRKTRPIGIKRNVRQSSGDIIDELYFQDTNESITGEDFLPINLTGTLSEYKSKTSNYIKAIIQFMDQGDTIEEAVDRAEYKSDQYEFFNKEIRDLLQIEKISTNKTLPSVDITPEIVQEVKKGLPMFQAKGTSEFATLTAETGIDLSNPVYAKMPSESNEQHLNRLIDEVRASLIGKYGAKKLEELAEDSDFVTKVKQWLTELFEWMKSQLGFGDASVDAINKMTLDEFVNTSFNSLMKGEYFEEISNTPAELIRAQILSNFRDNKRFKFADLQYPDVVFQDANTKVEAEIAAKFYTKIVNKFNKIFFRNVKLITDISDKNTFSAIVTYENNLTPNYYGYPTARMGEHIIEDRITQNTPLTSLRHELLHEALKPFILDKFERINKEDGSAEASTEEVQRKRAFSYSLEDIFFERVVESMERLPDGKDTFDMASFGRDVVNRINYELGAYPTAEEVDNYISRYAFTFDANIWLERTLRDILKNKVNYSRPITEQADVIGEEFKKQYNLNKRIVSDSLTSKLAEFTEFFNQEYQGVLTRLEKVKKSGVKMNKLFNAPLFEATEIANKYLKEKLDKSPDTFQGINKIDTALSKKLATAYITMEHTPMDKDTKEAYSTLIQEVKSQYEYIIEAGFTVELTKENPYEYSLDMLNDLRVNKRMKVLSTRESYGNSDITLEQIIDNSFLAKSGVSDVNGVELLNNDVFRFVHDFFGHAKLGNGFGPVGEENAWRIHAYMLSPKAVRALTTETRGQNSFVNFSGVNSEYFRIKSEINRLRKLGKEAEADYLQITLPEIQYAEQKIGLLPEEFSTLLGVDKTKVVNTSLGNPINFKLYDGETKFEDNILESEEGDDFALVERQFIENKYFSFTGKEKITSHKDVAYLFRALESESVEHLFAVHHLDGGEYVVQHISMGVVDSALFDPRLIRGVATKMGTKRITIVHNHPSGALYASEADHNLLAKIEESFKDSGTEVNGGVIINLRSGKYALFSQGISGPITMPENQDVVDIPTYSFSKQLFVNNYQPAKIVNSRDAAEFLSTQRFGTNLRTELIVLNRAQDVTGKFLLNNTQPLLPQILEKATIYGGSSVILFSNQPYIGNMDALKEPLRINGFPLMDFLEIESNNYRSLADLGIAEPSPAYTRETSELYESIAKNPHTTEQAKDIFLSVFSEKFKKQFGDWTLQKSQSPTHYKGGEPKIFYKTPSGDVFTSFAEALLNTTTGEISMGFISSDDVLEAPSAEMFEVSLSDVTFFEDKVKLENPDAFISVAELPADGNPFTKQGFINKYIREGLISPEMQKVAGEYKLVGKGAQDSVKNMSVSLLENEAMQTLGRDSMKVSQDGTFTLSEENTEEVKLTAKVGGTTSMSKSKLLQDLKNGKYAEYNERFDGFAATVYRLFRQDNDLYSPIVEPVQPAEETALINHLLKLLSGLGISVVTITDYVKNYQLRHGVDLSVDALADLANGVVAFAEGKMNVENLSEEVAHIIIEAHPNQEEINALLTEIEATEEFAQYSGEYYGRYAAMYSGAALDNAVRREILGKILSNRIRTGFNTSESFLQKLLDIFNNFLSNVRSYFLPSHKTKLDDFLAKTTDIVLRKNTTEFLDTDIMRQSSLVLYNTSSTNLNTVIQNRQRLAAQILKVKESLELRQKQVGKQKDPLLTTLRSEMKRLNAAIHDTEKYNAIQVIASINDAQIKHIQRQLEIYKKMPEGSRAFFNHSDQSTYNYLKNTALPQLVELKAVFEEVPEQNGVSKSYLTKQIETQIKEISDLEGKVFVQGAKDFDALFNKMTFEYGMLEDDRKNLRALFENEQKDTTSFQALFGQLEHASNPVLGLLGKLINKNYFNAEQNTLSTLSPLLKKAKEKGWNRDTFKNIIEKENGKNTGFLVSELKYKKFEDAEKAHKESLIEGLLTEDQKTAIAEDKRKPAQDDLDDIQLNKLFFDMEKWYDIHTERLFKSEYYKEKEERFTEAGVGNDLRIFLSNLSTRRAVILEPYRRQYGKIDYSNVSEEDIDALNRIAIERKAKKSLFNADSGERKVGVELEEALQLIKLDELTFAGAQKRNISNDFFTTLTEVENTRGTEEALKWLKANGGFTFSDGFWNAVSSMGKNIIDVIQDAAIELNSTDAEAATRLVEASETLSELLDAKKEILKQHSSPNSPSEIQYDLMGELARGNIRDLETRIQELFVVVNTALSKLNREEVSDPFVQTENTVNEAYHKALEDSQMPELAFIKEHLSPINKNNVSELERRLNIIKTTDRDFIEKRFLTFLQNTYPSFTGDVKALINTEGLDAIVANYGRNKVFSYFKRYSPAGYEAELFKLKNGGSVVALVNQIASVQEEIKNKTIEYNPDNIFHNLNVSTKFEWVEDEIGESKLNPNYKTDFDGGFRQPKASLYRNDEYFQKYSPNADGVATTNVEEWQMLQDFKAIMKTSLSLYGEDGRNVNKLPMKSKQTNEVVFDFNLNNAIQEAKDTIYNKVDDDNYGATLDGKTISDFSQVKVIPKNYITDLDDMEKLSTDLLFSYSTLLHSANLYTERHNTITDVAILEQKLLHTRFKNGKAPSATNTLKMYREFVDAYFYGVKISARRTISLPNGKEVDVSKFATNFDNFVRRINIGFNIPVAASSAFVSHVNLAIENRVGEFINTNSSRWAGKEMAKLLPNYMTNTGRIDRNDKLYMLGETFGLHDITDRTKNAGFNRVLRSMTDLPFAFMRMAATPHSNSIMLSVLDNFRLDGDRFIEFSEFQMKPENSGLNKKSVIERWNKLRDNSMYNLLEEKDGVMTLKDGLPIDEEYRKAIINRAQMKIKRVNGNIDMFTSQEDKSAASRHTIFRFFTAHRDWLTLAGQRRFKRNHFNFATGNYEEGHYMSAFRYMNNLFSLAKEKGVTNFLSAIKESYHTLTAVQQQNLGRVGRDLAAFGLLTLLTIPVAAAADDDDNKNVWPIQFMSFLYFRTVTEVGSSQAPMGVKNLLDMVKTPFVAVNALTALTDTGGWGTDDVRSGAYKGMDKWQRTLLKQWYTRHWFDLVGIQQKSDFYRLLNGESLFLAKKKSAEEKKEERLQEMKPDLIKDFIGK